jgi:hypothetical protein
MGQKGCFPVEVCEGVLFEFKVGGARTPQLITDLRPTLFCISFKDQSFHLHLYHAVGNV